MPRVTRTTDVIEVHWENALVYGLGAIVFLGLATLFYVYRGKTDMMYPLIAVLGTIGIACFGYAFYRAIEVRKVTSVAYTCPYCGVINELTEVAVADFTCVECHRLVPIIDGEIIDIAEVRCGYCNALNYYSAKSEFLICEECDREIPIHTDEPTKVAPTYMFRDDDESAYELVLSSPGPKT